VAGLLIVGFVGAVIMAYVADRIIKARAQARRLRAMTERLDAAAVRAEEQQEHRQAAAEASAALTSFMPAIKQPPLTVPDGQRRGASRPKAGCERVGQPERGSARPARPARSARSARRAARSGEHPVRPADRATRR